MIEKQIRDYGRESIQTENGTVVKIGDGVALIYGLENAMLGELLVFPKSDVYAMVQTLAEGVVGAVILGDSSLISEVGDELIGRVLDGIGSPIDGHGPLKNKLTRPVEQIATGVMARQSVNQPLETGILAIDAAIPIGKGQRELIIGDRQTGKTAIAIDTIFNQKGKNVKCIYVSIGQKDSTIAQIVEKLKNFGAMEYTTIVNASASESATLQYLAPYTGVKRAAKVNKDFGGGSITALPIIETQAGDISAYIPTNVISITDGQIFLSSELFNSGVRPAINIGPSVSRVGSSAQIKAIKQVSGTLKLELAQYYELEAFSKFGSDLDETTKATLEHGSRIIKMLIQKQYSPLSQVEEVILLQSIKSKLIK
ncbi:hypothetical protein FQA39_LY12791 [Lamprigera yunnana]|nr:hypothetical protein FQA39_LY12791 [Lamprigera yunnana]